MHTVSIGIDVSKDKFDAAFLAADRSSTVSTFANNEIGINHFIDRLNRQGTVSSVPCTLESTGMFHLPVAFMVTRAGYQVNCINPILTKKYQRSSIRNAKTDEIDALRLATIGIQEPNLPIFEANTEAVEVKKIVSYISKLEALKEQLKASTDSVLAMQKITGLSVDLSQTSLAITALQKQIKSLSREVIKRVPEDKLRLSREMMGISEERIAFIFALIGDKKFRSRDALIAFVGLDITPRQSGTWRGRGKLSKRGNGYARKLLFQMAWGLKQHNPLYRERYNELRKSGKSYKASLVILSRKFLRLLYSQYWKTC